LKGVHVRAHFSVATYARLFIPRLFCEYEKVIFIDADTVVECDIAVLMDEPLGNDLVAAVKDIVMEGFVKFGAVAQSDHGVQLAGEYLTKCLDMADPDKYFQAGLIVFNVAQMVRENTFTALIQALKEHNYWFLDQDIMNKVFYGHVHYLPMVWNVYHGNGNTDEFFPNLKFSTYMSFLKARTHPKMIHYAGDQKPWNNSRVDFFDNFSNYVLDTPWRGDFLDCLHGRVDSNDNLPSTESVKLQSKIKRWLMPMVNCLAPRGSSRRQVLGKTYYKIRRLLLG
jgi:lipopolysaccharide biosynthesis glycosyltransferase